MSKQNKGSKWKMIKGDCIEEMQNLKSNSIHYSIFSPPFASLYVYSDSPNDMGNCKDHHEFFEHFSFLTPELFRVMMPGRLVSIHCADLSTSKVKDGFIGTYHFCGDICKAMQEVGFIYHSKVTIWKDPVTAMQRTKALGLLHKQLKKDSCMSRQGIPDELWTFRKPGDNPEPVTKTNESMPVGTDAAIALEQDKRHCWQNYASPVWMDINPSNTLQRKSAREEKDERHICPLQLEVIERAIELWSNPGDTVLSPFAGIGSEGYVAVRMKRKFIGIELKNSYFKQACLNLANVELQKRRKTFFDE